MVHVAGLVVREVLVFRPGRHQFRPAQFPWLVKLEVLAWGGDGGAAADGTPGARGTTAVTTLARGELPVVVVIEPGAGGRGRGGGQDGKPGGVALLLWGPPRRPPPRWYARARRGGGGQG